MKTTLPLLPQLSTHILCAHIHFWDYFCLPALSGLGSAFVIGLLKSIQGKQVQIEELIAWPFGKNGNDSMMVTSYLINHNSRVGKTHWTMSFGQTILCRCLSNLFRQIFWGRFHLYMGALLTRCSSELIWVSCVIVRSQVSLLCILCSQVSNSCISFPVYLKCSRWFPGKICVFHFSDLYLGIFPPDFCYQSCFIFCLWGIPWLNVCDIRGLKRTEPFYSLHVFSFCRRGNPPDCTTAVLPMKWWFETENSILEICIPSAEKILLFLLQIVF